MNDNLIELLSVEAEELSVSYIKASIEGLGTPQEIADRREERFKSFLEKYFPFPYRIVKGNINDSFGERSQSIDCIVINPSHPYTIDKDSGRASIILADGVDYAIEIKSNLSDENEIERALKQIQSVKKLRRVKHGLLFKGKYNDEQLECARTIPGLIVAEKTYADIKLLVEKIYRYYRDNSVPKIEQFDLILINNKYLIYNFRNNTYVANDNMEGIAYWEGAEKCLALFLYEINGFPQSEPRMSESIMKLYLKDVRPKDVQHFSDLDMEYLS